MADGVAVCMVVEVEGVVVEVAAPVADGVVDVVLGVVFPVEVVPVVDVLVCALNAPAVANTTENSNAFFIHSPSRLQGFHHLDADVECDLPAFESCWPSIYDRFL